MADKGKYVGIRKHIGGTDHKTAAEIRKDIQAEKTGARMLDLMDPDTRQAMIDRLGGVTLNQKIRRAVGLEGLRGTQDPERLAAGKVGAWKELGSKQIEGPVNVVDNDFSDTDGVDLTQPEISISEPKIGKPRSVLLDEGPDADPDIQAKRKALMLLRAKGTRPDLSDLEAQR